MDEKIIGLDKNKDIDRRLEETTKELQREREKLMAVICPQYRLPSSGPA